MVMVLFCVFCTLGPISLDFFLVLPKFCKCWWGWMAGWMARYWPIDWGVKETMFKMIFILGSRGHNFEMGWGDRLWVHVTPFLVMPLTWDVFHWWKWDKTLSTSSYTAKTSQSCNWILNTSQPAYIELAQFPVTGLGDLCLLLAVVVGSDTPCLSLAIFRGW